jgi:hypothetical protein|tara:strand:- start:442 stop:783 length:342 start_codon:yes stop_codon:yes gene_type:complete
MQQLKEIAIGKEMRPLHFGFAALAEWCDMSGKGLADLGDIGDNLSLSSAINLIYCGLKHGARKKKKEFIHTQDDIADWIDEEGMEVFNECMEVFTESMTKIAPEEEKKKKAAK